MSSPIKNFLLKAIITSLVCYVIVIFLAFCFIKKTSFLEVYILIPFIMFITIGFHTLLIKATQSNNMLFVNKYIAFSGLKLIIYLISILIYLIFIKFEITVFLLSFLIIYFIYSIVEITSLLQIFKKN